MDGAAWCGFVLGVGFLQREFAIHGFAALLLVDALSGFLFTRDGFRKRLKSLRVFAEVSLVAQWVKGFSSGAGPGTTLADLPRSHDNVTELISRRCFDAATIPAGFWKLATRHWPVLFGTEKQPVSDFSVVTSVAQGSSWTGGVLIALAAIAAGAVIWRAGARRSFADGSGFCGYLVAAAAFSILGYVIGRCGAIDFYYTRYELLSVLGLAAVAAWFLRQDGPRWLRTSWLVLAAVWLAATAAPRVRLLREYLAHPPVDIRRVLIAHLDAAGHRYARSDYWIAYPLTFLTDERIIVASTDFVRIQEYEQAVDRQPRGVVRISRDRCEAGRQIVPGVWLCGP